MSVLIPYSKSEKVFFHFTSLGQRRGITYLMIMHAILQTLKERCQPLPLLSKLKTSDTKITSDQNGYVLQ